MEGEMKSRDYLYHESDHVKSFADRVFPVLQSQAFC